MQRSSTPDVMWPIGDSRAVLNLLLRIAFRGPDQWAMSRRRSATRFAPGRPGLLGDCIVGGQLMAVRSPAVMMWVSIATTSGPTMRTAMDMDRLGMTSRVEL